MADLRALFLLTTLCGGGVFVCVACGDDPPPVTSNTTSSGGVDAGGPQSSSSSSSSSSGSSGNQDSGQPKPPLATPTVSWSTGYPDSRATLSDLAVTTDGSGVVAIGAFNSATNPFTKEVLSPQPFYPTPWIAKHNTSDGKLAWSKSFPLAQWETGGFVTIAASGDGGVYVSGKTSAPTLSVALSATVTAKDRFVAKLDGATGTPVWSRTFDAEPGLVDARLTPGGIVADDADGIWLAATLKGVGRIDGVVIATLASTAEEEIAFLHLASADGSVKDDSFIVTSNGSAVYTAAGRAPNGDLVIAGLTLTDAITFAGGKVVNVPRVVSDKSRQVWAAFPKGSKLARWAGGQGFRETPMFAFPALASSSSSSSTSGAGVVVQEFQSTVTLGGMTFTNTPSDAAGIAVASVNGVDGAIVRPSAFSTAIKSEVSRLSATSVAAAASNNAYAFAGGDLGNSTPFNFGSGPLNHFVAWFEDGQPLHAFATPSHGDERFVFDSDRNLILADTTATPPANILGTPVNFGLYFMKIAAKR